jgi:hypothetical protein
VSAARQAPLPRFSRFRPPPADLTQRLALIAQMTPEDQRRERFALRFACPVHEMLCCDDMVMTTKCCLWCASEGHTTGLLRLGPPDVRSVEELQVDRQREPEQAGEAAAPPTREEPPLPWPSSIRGGTA